MITSSRRCEFSDIDFIQFGVARVLSQAKSGRDFLQSHAASSKGKTLCVSSFFDTLNSQRRLKTCSEVNELLRRTVDQQCKDIFAEVSELKEFDIYAGDGHYHKAAAHDPVVEDSKQPVGHFFIFNLRSSALHHFELALSGGFRKREHDMHAIKRRQPFALRFGAANGRKVLVVWDRAGIDFKFWHKAKQNGVYFISREKENMRLEVLGNIQFDKNDPINEGIVTDDHMATSQGVAVRRVIYCDPVTGVEFTFITSNLTLTPGIIAVLYKRRWDIEKAFDETKNRFQEGKSWGSSPNAKKMQGEFICIAYNLCLLMEAELENIEKVKNEPELKRRAKRIEEIKDLLIAKQVKVPTLYWTFSRMTQRGVKLMRWIRTHLYSDRLWSDAVDLLRNMYAKA